MSENKLRDKVVLITGASSGIGAAAGRRFAAAGASVALVARTRRKLEEVARAIRKQGGKARVFPADVSDPETCARLVDDVAGTLGGIDILVNNAGANVRGSVETQAPEALAQVVRVNLLGPVVLTRLVLPQLRRRGGGAVVNVASIAGQTPVPDEATYCATKAGLRNFSFALREELEGSGIRVSLVSPGPVDTGFIMDDIEKVPDIIFATPMSTDEEIADAVVQCALDGRDERTIPALTGYMAWVSNNFPAVRRVARPILEWRGSAVKEHYRKRS